MDDVSRPVASAKERQKSRLWAKRGLIAILIYALYPLSVTLALSTGFVERMLASEDLKVEITSPAWSLLPGDVHMGRVKIHMNGDAQFFLSVDNVTAQVRLLPLLRRRFEVSSIAGKNVVYQMRTQVQGEEAKSARARAFPPLPGLPGVQTKSEEVGAQTEEREADWTVHLRGIDVSVRELWFFEYRYLGRGRLKGGFERGPGTMRVDTSVQDLGPGELRFGSDQVISRNFRGQIEAEIPQLDPSSHANTSFFEYVNAKIHLQADIETLSHMTAYIPSQPSVSGGAGPLEIRIGMTKGLLAPETRVSYSTEDINLKGHGFGVKSDWDLLLSMDEASAPSPRPSLRTSSKISYVSLASFGKNAFTIQIPGHEETATLNSGHVNRNTEIQSARIHLPKIVTVDLDDLGGLIAKGDGLRTDGGQAEGSLNLELDDKKRLTGPFKMQLRRASVGLDKMTASTDGEASATISIDPRADRASIAHFSIALKHGQLQTDSARVDDYWINFQSKRIDLNGLPADAVAADISIVARDAEPMIRALAKDGKVPEIVADIFKLRNLNISAQFRRSERVTDVMLENLESTPVDFSGRFYQSPRQTRLALLIGGKDLALGIDRHEGRTSFQAFADEDWLNERLRSFPKPTRQVAGEKP